MDENKEKELLGEETAEELTEQEKEEVSEILEKLKNQEEAQVVTDWDGLAQVGDAENDIIAEDEPAEASDEEPEEEETELSENDMCIRCGKRQRYTELDEEYLYCKVCREDMKKTRMNAWGVLTFILTILSCFVCLIFGVFAVVTALPVVQGDAYMKDAKYSSAIACYEEAATSVEALNTQSGGVALFDVGNKTYAKLVRAYFSMGTPTYAQNYYTVLDESGALEKAKYKDAGEYYEIFDKMISTYSELQTTCANNLNTLFAKEEKADISEVEKYLTELEELKKDESKDKYMVAYFQYLFCSVTENSLDEGIKYLEEIKAGGRAYEFIYAIELCSAYLEKGEYEKAESVCYESLEASPENIGVYQYLITSKRRQGKYDEALKLADEAEKLAETMYVPESADTSVVASALPYSIPMEEAIVYALMGEKDKAIAAIDASYELGGDNSNLNVMILLHYLYHANGNEPTEGNDGEKIYDAEDEMYDMGMNVIANYGSYYGLSLSKNVKAIMDGEKTLEDVFVKGEVDWQ